MRQAAVYSMFILKKDLGKSAMGGGSGRKEASGEIGTERRARARCVRPEKGCGVYSKCKGKLRVCVLS